MSTRLEKILKEKRKQQEASIVDHQQIREAWTTDCSNLMTTISNWLGPLQDQKLLEIKSEKIPIFEDQLGEYEVVSLQIVFLRSEVVKIRPVARFIIGAKGRIDISTGGTLLVMMLAKPPGEWVFAKRNIQLGQFETWPFNRDTFDEFLSQFLE
jgi:hypothetical protein